MTATDTAPAYPKDKPLRITVEMINIDGSIMGSATMRFAGFWHDTLGLTLGNGYDARVTLPVPPYADPRCPYSVRVKVHP